MKPEKERQGGANLISVLACILIAVGCAIAAGIIAFFVGIAYRKKSAETAMGSAEQEAKRIVGDAIKAAEAKKKEAENGLK